MEALISLNNSVIVDSQIHLFLDVPAPKNSEERIRICKEKCSLHDLCYNGGPTMPCLLFIKNEDKSRGYFIKGKTIQEIIDSFKVGTK